MNLFDPEGMKERILELNEEMAEPDFWLDQEKAQKKNKELSDLEGKVKELEGFNKSIEDIFAMIELGIEMEDEEVQEEVFDLMFNLDATEEQLDFPVIYGSAKNNWMSDDWKKPRENDITPAIEALAGGKGSELATGGMSTKLKAAKMAMAAGTDMIITNGERPEVLYDIAEGKQVGTLFAARR